MSNSGYHKATMVQPGGRRRSWLISIAVGVLSLATLMPAQGQAAPLSFTTSPVSVDMVVSPGTSATTTLQIINNGSQAVPISMVLETFSANGTNGEASIAPFAPGDPSPTWVSFSTTHFTASPGIWMPVKLTLTLPKQAVFGYYYAVIFKPVIPTSSASHTATLEGSNAVLLLVDTHSANEQRQLTVNSFSVSKRLYEYLPASFAVTVRNSGNIYVLPIGDIYISRRSDFSSIIDTISVNGGHGNVLPKSVRQFQAQWSDGFPVFRTETVGGQPVMHNGQPVQHLAWDFTQLSKFRIGRYYAHLALVYNNGTQDIPIDSVVSFWVFPWKLFAVLLLIILIILVGLFGVAHALYTRLRRRSRKQETTKL